MVVQKISKFSKIDREVFKVEEFKLARKYC